MKRINILLTAVLALAAGFSSCDDDLAQPPVNLPEGGVGTGAWDSPMTAYQASLGSFNAEYPEPWVKGYIVGYIDTNIANVLKDETAKFTADGAVNTNMLIAMSPDEKDWKNCATVQLPSGPVRNALNLSGNPGNLGKLVCIKGTTGTKYCSAYGVRSVSAFNWGDVGIDTGEEPTPPNPDVPAGSTIYEGLKENATGWNMNDAMSPEGLERVWSWDAQYNCLKGTAFKGQVYVADVICESPEIDLSSLKDANLSYEYVVNNYKKNNEMIGVADFNGYAYVMIREAGASTWNVLSEVKAEAFQWKPWSTGVCGMKDYAGKKVQIGFRYVSTADVAGTWEIKNVKVTGTK